MRLAERLIAVAIGAAALVVPGLVSTRPDADSLGQPLVDATPINQGTSWYRTQPHVAYDSTHDRYLFVWRDKRNDEPGNRRDELCDYPSRNPPCWPNADIYGRLVAGDGTIIGTEDIPIATDDPEVGPRDQQWPAVVYNPDKDEYLVAWQEVSPHAVPGGNTHNWYSYCYDIKAQRLDSLGQPIGEPITVSAAIDCQWVPVISYDTKLKEYLIAWHDHRYRNWNWDPPREYRTKKEIFAQWLTYNDDQLLPDGDNFFITTDIISPTQPAPEYQQYSAIAYNPDTGDHYIFWSDDRLPDPETTQHHYDIFFQRLPGGSTDAISNTLLYQAPYVQEKPRASFNGLTGEVWAIWQSYEGLGTTAHNFAVEMARLTADGILVGDVITVASGLGSYPHYPLPDIACSHQSGNCLTMWTVWVAGSKNPVYQLFDEKGSPLTSPVSLGDVSYWEPGTRVIANDNPSRPEFMMTFSDGDTVYFAVLRETIPTPTPTATSTPTATPTPTPTVTPTSTPSSTPTETPTPTITPSSTPTETPTPTPSSTPTATASPTATCTPTATRTPTVTPSPTRTPKPTKPTPRRVYLPMIVR